MKALTIWQPWATLIAMHAKPYEFRKWDYTTRVPQLVGQRLVIHAATRAMRHSEIVDLHIRLEKHRGEGTGLIVDVALPIITRIRNSMEGKGEPFDLPLAAALCSATLLRARRAADLFRGTIADSDRIDQHVYAWPLQAVEPFRHAIPCRGSQGFWNFPADLERDAGFRK